MMRKIPLENNNWIESGLKLQVKAANSCAATARTMQPSICPFVCHEVAFRSSPTNVFRRFVMTGEALRTWMCHTIGASLLINNKICRLYRIIHSHI